MSKLQVWDDGSANHGLSSLSTVVTHCHFHAINLKCNITASAEEVSAVPFRGILSSICPSSRPPADSFQIHTKRCEDVAGNLASSEAEQAGSRYLIGGRIEVHHGIDQMSVRSYRELNPGAFPYFVGF
jgi:hypothetical protein